MGVQFQWQTIIAPTWMGMTVSVEMDLSTILATFSASAPLYGRKRLSVMWAVIISQKGGSMVSSGDFWEVDNLLIVQWNVQYT